MSWKCPKCGREFSRQDQAHFCEKPKTIDDYILSQDETIRTKLNEVREILRSAIPDAEERISWSMPTYWKGQNLIHFAASLSFIDAPRLIQCRQPSRFLCQSSMWLMGEQPEVMSGTVSLGPRRFRSRQMRTNGRQQLGAVP